MAEWVAIGLVALWAVVWFGGEERDIRRRAKRRKREGG